MSECELVVWGNVVLFLIFAVTVCSLEGLHQSRIFYAWKQQDDGEELPRRADDVI